MSQVPLDERDAEIFDRLLTEAFQEALQRECADAAFWERALANAETEAGKKYAQDKLDGAAFKLVEELHRQKRWITSATVTCEDPGCPSHHAVFVGLA